MGKNRDGICHKCREYAALTKHHILPLAQGFSKNGATIKLCRPCHDDVEDFIDEKEWECSDRSATFYLKVNNDWLFNHKIERTKRKKAS